MTFYRIIIFLLMLLVPLATIVPHTNASSNTADELYTAQGVEKVNAGQYRDALEVLGEALETAPDNQEALYYSGVAYARLGKYKKAEKLFIKTLQIDENNENALLELGRIYYSTGNCDKIKETLSRFIALTMEDELEKHALELIQNCRQKEEKPYKLSALAGAQYDSNVILETSYPGVSTGKKSDTSALFYLTGSMDILKTDEQNLKMDYNFYQTLHSSLSNFDIQYHKITPRFEIALSDKIKPAAGYVLEYTTVGGDSYSRTHTFYGKVSVAEGEKFSTEAIYEYKDRKYFNSSAFTTNSDRTGKQSTLGLKQNFDFSKLTGNAYYFNDFNTARQAYYSFNGYRIGAELDYNISSFYLNLGIELAENRYRGDEPGSQTKRTDSIQEYNTGVTYVINKKLGVILKNTYTVNDSNIKDYNYTRNVTGLFLWKGIL